MVLKIKPEKITKKELLIIIKELVANNFIVYPTDTVYGLGCLADKEELIKKIKKFKKRDSSKPFIILVSSLRMAKKYCVISKKQEILVRRIWQTKRPTSIILKHKNLLGRELSGNKETLALRLPKSSFLLKIIRAVKRPLVSTSFNFSGQPVLNRVDDLNLKVKSKNQPSLIIDGGKLVSKPSRVVDLTTDKLLIVRK